MRFESVTSKHREERILPLINVVFLLLIFFLLAGRLAATDPFQVEAPRSLGGTSVEGHDVVVHIGADARLALDGSVLDESELQTALAQRVTSGAVRLKADSRVETKHVIAVMEILREAGAERLELLTIPE